MDFSIFRTVFSPRRMSAYQNTISEMWCRSPSLLMLLQDALYFINQVSSRPASAAQAVSSFSFQAQCHTFSRPSHSRCQSASIVSSSTGTIWTAGFFQSTGCLFSSSFQSRNCFLCSCIASPHPGFSRQTAHSGCSDDRGTFSS